MSKVEISKLKVSEVFNSVECGLVQSISEAMINEDFDDGVTPYDFICEILRSHDKNQERIKGLEAAILKMNYKNEINTQAVRDCYEMVNNND